MSRRQPFTPTFRSVGASSMSGLLRVPLSHNSDEQLFVDLDSVLPAITQIVVDKPEDVQRLQQVAVVIEELDRAIEPEDRLHPVRIVGNQRVDRSGTLLYIAARACHPIVFQIAPVPL